MIKYRNCYLISPFGYITYMPCCSTGCPILLFSLLGALFIKERMKHNLQYYHKKNYILYADMTFKTIKHDIIS